MKLLRNAYLWTPRIPARLLLTERKRFRVLPAGSAPGQLFSEHRSVSFTAEECPSEQSCFARIVFHCWERSFLFHNTALLSLRGTQSLLLFPTPYSSEDNFRNLLSTQQSPSAVNSKSFAGASWVLWRFFWPSVAMETTDEVHGRLECFELVLLGAKAANRFSLAFPQSFQRKFELSALLQLYLAR